jgi:hypothetical protein
LANVVLKIFRPYRGWQKLFRAKPTRFFCDSQVELPTLKFLFADTSDAALRRWNRDHQPHRERLAR